MCNTIIDQLKTWKQNKDGAPRVCLMSGVGGKAFCAGGDIVSIYKAAKQPVPDLSVGLRFFAREYLLDYSLS